MSSLDPAVKALIAFAIAVAVAWALTPLSGRFARRVGAVAQVSERSLHSDAIPTIGGIAILAGLLAGSLVFLPVNTESMSIVAGAILITAVGALDDARDLTPVAKFAGQAVVALIPISAGVYVDHVTLPFLGVHDLGNAGPVLTLIGMAGLMNVINFSDGVDGLAAGVCMIAAATFAAIAVSLDRVEAAVLAAASAGACLGFLRYNFHPAKIFMGDAGSNLLGFMLAVIAIQGVLKTAAVVALAFPLAIMAVPILDTGFVVAKRIKYGQPVYQADTWHFHHRFVAIGFSQRRTVAYLYGWTASLALFALALRFVPYSDNGGDFHLGWTVVLGCFGLIAIAASFYLVIVLEILKLRRFRSGELRSQRLAKGHPEPSAQEINAEVAEDLSTGEFPALRGKEPRV